MRTRPENRRSPRPRRRHGDEGAETVEVMLWIAVIIAVVGIVGAIFRDDIRDFFNSLTYSIGF